MRYCGEVSNRTVELQVSLLFLLTSVLFYRGVRDSFDLTKATIAWLFLPLLTFTVILQVLRKQRHNPRRDLVISFFFLALLISTFMSQNFWASWYGQPFRYTGLLTWSVGIIVLSVVSRMNLSRSEGIVEGTILFAVLVSCVYVLIQSIGVDPYAWSITSFGEPIFGTIGNPNTAAGFVSVPFALALIGRREERASIRLMSLMTLIVIGPAVSHLRSFQGNVSLVTSLVLVALWTYRKKFAKAGFIEVAFLGSSALGISFMNPSKFLWLISFAVIFLVCVAMRVINYKKWMIVKSVVSERRRSILFVFGGIALLAVPLLGPTVWSGIESGMLERKYFYQSAVQSFFRNPVVGSGFETFGFEFSKYREAAHAISLEDSRTTSVHSLPLAMLQGGGLILFLGFLALLGYVSWQAIRILRQSGSTDRAASCAICWFAGVVQMLVSVEHVSLTLLYCILGGLVLSYGQEEEREIGSSRRTRRRKEPRVKVSHSVIALASASIAAIPAGWATQVFRSELRETAAREALNSGDGTRGLELYREAVEINPHDALIRYQFSDLLELAGNRESSFEQSFKAAAALGWPSPMSLRVAARAANIGNYRDASLLIERAVSYDPHAPGIRASALDLTQQIAESATVAGLDEISTEFSDLASRLEEEGS